MKGGLVRRVVAAAALATVAVAVVLGLLVRSIEELREASSEADRAQRVLVVANRAERFLVDVQTGARGFIITGQERFLEPFDSGRVAFRRESDRLVEATGGNQVESALALRIQRLGREYTDEYATGLVALARRDERGAREEVARGEGKRRVDELRVLFDELLTIGASLSRERQSGAEEAEDLAHLLGRGGFAGSVLLLVLLTAYVARFIAAPVRGVAQAARRLEAGDLSTRLEVSGADEVAQLGRAFNAMADGLQRSTDELESQNTELALQATELEERQHELAATNDELRAQRDELERTASELTHQKERIEAFHRFGERLTAGRGLAATVDAALTGLAGVGGAPVGTLYAPLGDDGRWSLLGAHGVARGDLPAGLAAGEGLAGQALRERRPVWVGHGATGLRARVLTGEVAVRRELHLPLTHGDRAVGVVSLGWLDETAAPAELRETLERIGDQAAVAIANALAEEETHRLSTLNRIVLDAARDGVVLVGPDGRISLANVPAERYAREILGVGVEELPRRLGDLAELSTDPEGARAAFARIAADPDGETEDTLELAASGRAITFFTARAAGHDGAPIGRMIVMRDVTRERQAEQLKSDLMATVSHELRTPLASVIGFAELMLTRDLNAETRAEHLGRIHTEGRRLSRLIDDFLDLQKLERGAGEPELEPVPVADVLDHQVRLFSAQSDAHAIELEPADPGLRVRAERDRVAQVTANLISNAIKYSPGGGRVAVAARRQGDRVLVSLTDEGIGIPGDQRERVFSRFFRVDSSDTRRIGGTGLGLALVREIVEGYGGEVGFDSVEGRGSRFWFALPAA